MQDIFEFSPNLDLMAYTKISEVHSNTRRSEYLKKGVSHLDLVKFVMCTMVFRVHMTFYTLTKGYTVPGNQDTHDKLN